VRRCTARAPTSGSRCAIAAASAVARAPAFALTALALWTLGCLAPNHLLDADPVNADLTIHVVVENPAGSSEKWEVRADGQLVRETRDGRAIEIPYLPWPANGGMIPRTLHSAELGGDGEPLDVLVLGAALPRGATVRVRPIGMLRVVDRLERDDKILAVPTRGVFSDVTDVEMLEQRYPGAREIVARWYTHARPGDAIEVQGFAPRAAAAMLIEDGVRAFDAALRDGTLPDWQTP
jgi:inorganic pyrophosphatase